MTRILIVDDHALIGRGLSHVFSGCDWASEVHIVSDPASVLGEVARLRPDAMTLDLAMPGIHGLDLIGQIKAQVPGCRIVVLTGLTDLTVLAEVFRAGPHAMVQKQGDPGAVVDAMMAAPRPEPHLCAEMERLLGQLPIAEEAPEPLALSSRERQIVGLLAEGMTTKDIADRLGVSEHTIRKHRENMMRKIAAKSTSQLVAYAVNRGLI